MVLAPPICVFLNEPRHPIDWSVIDAALWLYLAAFVGYLALQLVRTARKLDDEKNREIAKLKLRLEGQVSVSALREGDPRIEVEFSDERKFQARTASLTVVNRGARPARMVRIHPLKLGTRTIEFPGFSETIGPDESARFAPELGSQWGYDSHSDFVRAMSEHWIKGTDYRAVRETSAYVQVDYEDDAEVRFETTFELLYHGGFANYNPDNLTIMECKDFRYRRIPPGTTQLE
jgi:hypothetical protein